MWLIRSNNKASVRTVWFNIIRLKSDIKTGKWLLLVFFSLPSVNDKHHIWDSHARLCDVGRQYNLKEDHTGSLRYCILYKLTSFLRSGLAVPFWLQQGALWMQLPVLLMTELSVGQQSCTYRVWHHLFCFQSLVQFIGLLYLVIDYLCLSRNLLSEVSRSYSCWMWARPGRNTSTAPSMSANCGDLSGRGMKKEKHVTSHEFKWSWSLRRR